jgi:hypothetical protein
VSDLLNRVKRLEGSGSRKPQAYAIEINSDLENSESAEAQVMAITKPYHKFNRPNRPKLPPVDPKEPQFITPSDDKTHTSKGLSPEKKMLLPESKGKKYRCRWCWSTKHWGKECTHAEAGRKKLLDWIAKRPKAHAIDVDCESEHESSGQESPYEEDETSEN